MTGVQTCALPIFTNMANIAFTGSHNSTFVVEDKGRILLVLETERFLGYKNSGITQYKIPENPFFVFERIMDYIKKFTGFEEFENCFCIDDNVVLINGIKFSLSRLIKARNYISTKHHYSHAGSTFYQSPFSEALVFSFDGRGNDGSFNIYHADREKGIQLIKNVEIGRAHV